MNDAGHDHGVEGRERGRFDECGATAEERTEDDEGEQQLPFRAPECGACVRPGKRLSAGSGDHPLTHSPRGTRPISSRPGRSPPMKRFSGAICATMA